MIFIFIFISSSDPNLLRKKSVKQKIKKKLWPPRKIMTVCHEAAHIHEPRHKKKSSAICHKVRLK